jgi:hypothetical protein
MDTKNIGSLSMKGGRNDNFYFCLIEYYPESHRWFLKSLLPVKDEEANDSDEAIRAWIHNFGVKQLVVDFPLSKAACADCEIECPGAGHCPKPVVVTVREKIKNLLNNLIRKILNLFFDSMCTSDFVLCKTGSFDCRGCCFSGLILKVQSVCSFTFFFRLF